MTKFGMSWRRGFVLGASLALLVSAAPATTVAQTEDSLEPVDIMHYMSAEFGGKFFEQLLLEYQGETGRLVRVNLIPHEAFKTVILTTLAGGNPPDFYTDWAGARVASRVNAGVVAPIDDMWEANDLDSAFPQGIIDSAATYGDGKYAMPLNYHVSAMWYNPSVMEAAGVAVPIETWDGLMDACETLKGAGVIPFALGSKDSWTAQFWFDYILLRTAGPEYRARLMAGEASYTDPEVIRTMELWGELVSAGCFNEDANAKGYTDAADMVANGDAAMNLMGTWIVGYWGDAFEPVTDYDFFPFPAMDLSVESAVVGPVDALSVSAGGDNPEGAKDLMAFFARPDVQAKWAKGQGALPVNVNAETPDNPTLVKALALAGAAETYNFNYDLATPPAPSLVGLDMFQKFMHDPGDIQGLMEETQSLIEKEFANQ
jgi:ABC-type glycerol-3-phosphate transport system substrate-binding protein